MKSNQLKMLEARAPSPERRSEWLTVVDHYKSIGLVDPFVQRFMEHQVYWAELYGAKPFYNWTKSVFDRSLACAVLLSLLPLWIVICAAIVLTTGDFPLYSQIRIGRFGSPFKIYKFRTMRRNVARAHLLNQNEMKQGMFKMKDDPRVTGIGRILRRWSLDELPQVINILRGDMSFVGPRPLVPEDSCCVPDVAMVRFAAVPGLTGFWQATIRGSSEGSLKIQLDAEYALQRCWAMDLRLILRTLPSVIKGTGAF